MAQDKQTESFLKKVLSYAGGTLFSRILGFIRDILIIHILGPAADVFLAAFRLPNFVRRLTAEGALGLSHAVALGRFDSGSSSFPSEQSYKYSMKITLIFILIGLILSILLALSARVNIWFLAPGFTSDPQKIENFVLYFRLCLAYIPLAAGSAILSTSLVAYGRAGFASFSPALLNLGIIVLLLFSLAYQNIMNLPAEASSIPSLLVCCGVILGAFLQFFWLAKAFSYYKTHDKSLRQIINNIPSQVKKVSGLLKKIPMLLKKISSQVKKIPMLIKKIRADSLNSPSLNSPSLNSPSLSSPSLSSPLKKLPASLLASSSSQLHFLISAIAASFLGKGSISAIYLAERMVEFPLALSGVVLATIAMPEYSKLAAKDLNLGKSLISTLSLCAFIALPAAAGLAALAHPIAELLFAHGYFSSENAAKSAQLLSITALSLPAMALTRPLLNALICLDSESYAKKASPKKETESFTKKAARISFKSSIFVLAFSFIFMPFLNIYALAIALFMGSSLHFYLLWQLGKKGKILPSFKVTMDKEKFLLAASVLLFIILRSSLNFLPADLSRLYLAFYLAALIPASIILWFAFFYLAKNEEAVKIISILRSLKK